MDRRDLFKSALGAIGGYFALPKFLQANQITQIKPVLQKKDIVLSEDFFNNLQIVRESIRRQIDFRSLLRKTLMVDELPQNVAARYEKGSKTALVWHKGEKINEFICDFKYNKYNGGFKHGWQGVIVPTFEIPSQKTAKEHECIINNEKDLEDKDKRDQLANKLSDLYIEEESEILFKLLYAATENTGKHIRAKYNSKYKDVVYYLNRGFHSIEQHDLVVCKILMHNETFKKIIASTSNKDSFDRACEPVMLSRVKSLWGHLWTGDIHVSNQCPKNVVYLTAFPSCVGVMPIRQDICILSSQINNKIRLYDWEEIGAAIINNYTVARIDFR